MGKFSDFILVSDFDHTMTDKASHVPPVNLDAIRRFMEQGGIFTLATGRSLPMSKYRFREVPVNAPWIVCNGAACYDPVEEKALFCHPLPEHVMPVLRELADRYPHLRAEFHTMDAHYIFGEDADRDFYLNTQKAKFAHVPWEEITEPKIKFCLYVPGDAAWWLPADSEEGRFFAKLEKEVNALSEEILALNSMPALLEIQAAGTSKGKAARDLAQKLGRSVLVCAGDAVNDLSMLEEADVAFVPADCQSAVKERGFREAAPCGEGTIADIIHKLEELL